MQHGLAGEGPVDQLPRHAPDLAPRGLDPDMRFQATRRDESGQAAQPRRGRLTLELAEKREDLQADAASGVDAR